MLRPCHIWLREDASISLPDHAPTGDQRLSNLGSKLLCLSPSVARWTDDELVVDLAPSGHLFGSEKDLMARLRESVAKEDFSCRMVAADSLAAARLACRLRPEMDGTILGGKREAKFVNSLPMKEIFNLPEFLSQAEQGRLFFFLGLQSVRDFLLHSQQTTSQLLNNNCKDALLYATRSNRLASQLHFISPRMEFTESLSFSPPLCEMAFLLTQLAEGLARLQEKLYRRHLLACALQLELTTEAGDTTVIDIVPADPTRGATGLLSLCRLRLDRISLLRPLAQCRLAITRTGREGQAAGDLILFRKRRSRMTFGELRSRLDTALQRSGALFRVVPADALLPEQRHRCVTSPRWPTITPLGLRDEEEQGAEERELPALLLCAPRAYPLPGNIWADAQPFCEFEFFHHERCRLVTHRYYHATHRGRRLLIKRHATGSEVTGIYD